MIILNQYLDSQVWSGSRTCLSSYRTCKKEFKFEKYILCGTTGEKLKWGSEATIGKGVVYETVAFDALPRPLQVRLPLK